MDFICKEKTKHPTDVNKNENASQKNRVLKHEKITTNRDTAQNTAKHKKNPLAGEYIVMRRNGKAKQL